MRYRRRSVQHPTYTYKRKYHAKVTSDSAMYINWIRCLDVSDIFAEFVWLNVSAFDLAELGLGLLYSILPVDFEPLAVDREYERPTPDEALQGIWVKFRPVRFDLLYAWMTDFREYVVANIKEEFQTDFLLGLVPKAYYGVTPWGRGVYDPTIAREMLRATFHRLRLLRKPDFHWKAMMDQIADYLEMLDITDEHVFNRLMLLFSAQFNAFILGLSILGRGRLCEMDGEYAVIPFRDAQGNEYDVKVRTLDHIQLGFILGVTPLGYGILLPKESIYKLPEGKRNPPIIDVIITKIRGMINRLTLSAFAYTNYSRADELTDYHKSDRTTQYDLLQSQRRFVEEWVKARIPRDEANPVRIRQYQNAVLQLVYWRAKRHRWGFKAWERMTEDEFKGWWKGYWKGQGLNESTLESIFEAAKVWLPRLREERLRLGKAVKEARKRLALSV